MVRYNIHMARFKNFVIGFLSILFLLIFSFLFCLSLFTTGLNLTYESEVPIMVKDNLFINIILILITAILFYYLYKFIKKYINRNIFLIICVIACVGFSILWVLSSNVEPDADQTAVCLFAHYFNDLNYFGLNRGEYVGIYQQQLGLISIIQLVYKMFGDNNYRAFQLLNTLFIGLFIISNDMIIRNFDFEYKEDAEIIYLILSITFIPLFIYSDYVYGEIISIGTISMCFWMLISYRNKEKLYKLVLVIISGFLACYVRLNSIIFIIAAFLIIMMSLIISYNPKKLVLLFGVVLMGILAITVPKIIYGHYIPDDSYTMPATLHISMGMQDEAGWFNSYNTNTYQIVNFDPIEADNWAREDIKNRVDYFKKNPSIGLNFYYNKINLQWNSPMMQSLWMNHKFNGTPGRFAASFYEGNINSILNVISSCHQMFVYLMCIIFSLSVFINRKMIKMEELIFIVFVIGGFFFSILWEAKTRYILPYYSALLIEASFGFSYLVDNLLTKKPKHKLINNDVVNSSKV